MFVKAVLKNYPTITSGSVRITVEYTVQEAEEAKAFLNASPYFVDPIPSNYTFNFTEPAVDTGAFSIGVLQDLEEDPFTVSFPGAESFLEPTFSEDSKEVQFSLIGDEAKNGNYDLPIEVV